MLDGGTWNGGGNFLPAGLTDGQTAWSTLAANYFPGGYYNCAGGGGMAQNINSDAGNTALANWTSVVGYSLPVAACAYTTATSSPTGTSTAMDSPSPSDSPTDADTASATPTVSPSFTASPAVSDTASPTGSETPAGTPTDSPTLSASPTPTVTLSTSPSSTLTATSTETGSSTATSSASPTPSATVTVTPYTGSVLTQGDAVFLGFSTGSANRQIAFMLLTSVTAGTQIGICNQNYAGTGSFAASSGNVVWTADQAYPAGTQIVYSRVGGNSNSVTAGTIADGGSTSGGIGVSNPKVLTLFQGTVNNNPTFIAQILMGTAYGSVSATALPANSNGALTTVTAGVGITACQFPTYSKWMAYGCTLTGSVLTGDKVALNNAIYAAGSNPPNWIYDGSGTNSLTSLGGTATWVQCGFTFTGPSTPTSTVTLSSTPTNSPAVSATDTPTLTPSASASPSSTASATVSPSSTVTPSFERHHHLRRHAHGRRGRHPGHRPGGGRHGDAQRRDDHQPAG